MEDTNSKFLGIWQRATYNHANLAIFHHLKSSNMDDKCVTTLYSFVLCINGSISLNFNGNQYNIHKNDLFVYSPNAMIKNLSVSDDWECDAVCMSGENIQRIFPLMNNIVDTRLFLRNNPLISLKADEASRLFSYYDFMYPILTQSSGKRIDKIAESLVSALGYELQNIMDRLVKTTPRPFTSKEHIFKSFIDIISTSYPKNRNAAFYAEQLHITPKYLSIVCKETGGETTTKIINRFVSKDIEYLLKHTQKTIKDICNELDFPNISFFGKYVKNNFGDSPKALRKRYLKEHQE